MIFDNDEKGYLFCIPHRYDLVIFFEYPELSFWGDSKHRFYLNNKTYYHSDYGEFAYFDFAVDLFGKTSRDYHDMTAN
jgi:hypothetical protein